MLIQIVTKPVSYTKKIASSLKMRHVLRIYCTKLLLGTNPRKLFPRAAGKNNLHMMYGIQLTYMAMNLQFVGAQIAQAAAGAASAAWNKRNHAREINPRKVAQPRIAPPQNPQYGNAETDEHRAFHIKNVLISIELAPAEPQSLAWHKHKNLNTTRRGDGAAAGARVCLLLSLDCRECSGESQRRIPGEPLALSLYRPVYCMRCCVPPCLRSVLHTCLRN